MSTVGGAYSNLRLEVGIEHLRLIIAHHRRRAAVVGSNNLPAQGVLHCLRQTRQIRQIIASRPQASQSSAHAVGRKCSIKRSLNLGT